MHKYLPDYQIKNITSDVILEQFENDLLRAVLTMDINVNPRLLNAMFPRLSEHKKGETDVDVDKVKSWMCEQLEGLNDYILWSEIIGRLKYAAKMGEGGYLYKRETEEFLDLFRIASAIKVIACIGNPVYIDTYGCHRSREDFVTIEFVYQEEPSPDTFSICFTYSVFDGFYFSGRIITETEDLTEYKKLKSSLDRAVNEQINKARE